jgi:hypothetical protein
MTERITDHKATRSICVGSSSGARVLLEACRSVGPATDKLTFRTGGIFHEPSMIEGFVSFGQYMRSIKTNLQAGSANRRQDVVYPTSLKDAEGDAYEGTRKTIEEWFTKFR